MAGGETAILGLIATPLLGLVKKDGRKIALKYSKGALRMLQKTFGIINQEGIDEANAQDELDEANEGLAEAQSKLDIKQKAVNDINDLLNKKTTSIIGYCFPEKEELLRSRLLEAEKRRDRAESKKDDAQSDRDDADFILAGLKRQEALEDVLQSLEAKKALEDAVAEKQWRAQQPLHTEHQYIGRVQHMKIKL